MMRGGRVFGRGKGGQLAEPARAEPTLGRRAQSRWSTRFLLRQEKEGEQTSGPEGVPKDGPKDSSEMTQDLILTGTDEAMGLSSLKLAREDAAIRVKDLLAALK